MGAIAAVQSLYAGYKRRDYYLSRTGYAEGAEITDDCSVFPPGVIPAHPLASFHAGCHGNRSVESPWLAIKQYLQHVAAIGVGIFYIYFVINLVIRTALVCGDIL